MSSAFTPDDPIPLLPRTLTFPAEQRSPHSDRCPDLKVCFTPYVTVPSALISEVTNRKDLETCMDVVIAVGGKVTVELKVEASELLAPGSSLESEVAVEMEVRKRVKCIIEAVRVLYYACRPADDQSKNKGPLGLQSSLDPAALNELTPDVLLELCPFAALPSHTPTAGNLMSLGLPIAYLKSLQISIRWASHMPSKAARGKHSDESLESGQEREAQDEKDVSEDHVMGAHAVDGDATPISRSVLPQWAADQLNQGVIRWIQSEVIGRFPLIFDGGLLGYSRALTLPSSLTTAIAHFLSSSALHHTSLLPSAKAVLRGISLEQETHLEAKVHRAVRLQSKQSFRKRRTLSSDIHAATIRIKGKRQAAKKSVAPAVSDLPEDRASRYLEEVGRARLEMEGADIGGKSRQLVRSVNEAVGRLGRAFWEEKRNGRGRMACYKIKMMETALSTTPLEEGVPVRESIVTDQARKLSTPQTQAHLSGHSIYPNLDDIVPDGWRDKFQLPPSPMKANTYEAFAEDEDFGSYDDSIIAESDDILEGPPQCAQDDLDRLNLQDPATDADDIIQGDDDGWLEDDAQQEDHFESQSLSYHAANPSASQNADPAPYNEQYSTAHPESDDEEMLYDSDDDTESTHNGLEGTAKEDDSETSFSSYARSQNLSTPSDSLQIRSHQAELNELLTPMLGKGCNTRESCFFMPNAKAPSTPILNRRLATSAEWSQPYLRRSTPLNITYEMELDQDGTPLRYSDPAMLGSEAIAATLNGEDYDL